MKSVLEAMSIPPRTVRSSTEALLKAAKIGPELTRASLDSMQDLGGTFGRDFDLSRIIGSPAPFQCNKSERLPVRAALQRLVVDTCIYLCFRIASCAFGNISDISCVSKSLY